MISFKSVNDLITSMDAASMQDFFESGINFNDYKCLIFISHAYFFSVFYLALRRISFMSIWLTLFSRIAIWSFFLLISRSSNTYKINYN